MSLQSSRCHQSCQCLQADRRVQEGNKTQACEVLVCLNFAFWRLSQCKSRNHKQTYRILSNLTTLLLDQSFGIVLVSLCSSFPEGYGRHAGLIKRLTLKRHGICSYGCYNHRIHRICRVGRLAIKPLAHARSQEKGICDARPKDVCACGRRR